MFRNGQRKYGGPPQNWTGPPPTKGSEVFVGNIPRDLMESDILAVFERVGPVFEIRLMMDAVVGNRGFAFVTMATPAVAAQAIQLLNRFEIRPHRFIGVIRSLDNCRLFIGGIPKDKSQEDIREEMSRLTDGVVAVILYSAIADKSKNRGFAFVEYESHRAAAIARRKYMPAKLQLWGKSVALDWAEPEPTVEEEILSKVRVLYVRNLLVNTPEKVLHDLFNAVSDDGVEKVKVLNDYAFVHFASRFQAQQAMDSLQNQDLDGAQMQITWAKPVVTKKKSCNLPSKLAFTSMAATQLTGHQSQYTGTVPQAWPHLTFSHPAAIRPDLNNLPCHAFPPFTFYPQQSPLCNYVGSDRHQNQQLPAVYLYRTDYPPQLPSDYIHQPNDADPSQQGVLSLTKGNYTDNVKILTAFCRLHNLGEPLFGFGASADHRYAAKVTIAHLGRPYNVFQVAETFKTENEAQQAIAGRAINHAYQVLLADDESALCSPIENVSLKANVFPANYIASM